MSFTQPQPPHDQTRPTTATEQIETSPDIVNDSTAAHVSVSDVPTGEDIAREKQAEDSNDETEVNVLGDQDAANLQDANRYPPEAHLPTAQNVRRYPELFDQAVIDSFNVPDPNDEVVDEVDDTAVNDEYGDSGYRGTF